MCSIMPKINRITNVLFGVLVLSLATEHSLKAYADPGSGAMFVQIILAGIIGCLFRVRSMINRVRNWKKGREEAAFPRNDGLIRPSE